MMYHRIMRLITLVCTVCSGKGYWTSDLEPHDDGVTIAHCSNCGGAGRYVIDITRHDLPPATKPSRAP